MGWLLTDRLTITQLAQPEGVDWAHSRLQRIVNGGGRVEREYGHLVIFDRTPGKVWEERIFQREEHYRDAGITVCGM